MPYNNGQLRILVNERNNCYTSCMEREDLATAITKAQRKYGVSLQDVAKVLGCSRMTLNRWKRGKHLPQHVYVRIWEEGGEELLKTIGEKHEHTL